LGQGRENAKEYLRQNPELADRIEQNIRHSSSDTMPMKVAVGTGRVEEDAEFALE
jgi:recombination protein RecA